MSQMCMCASCLKPYLGARLLFLAIKKLCYHMMEVISIVGCCFQLLCGLPFGNRVRAGMTFVSKSRLAVFFLWALS